MNPHALERFVEIAERPGNERYRERLEQVISRLIRENTPETRRLLARIFIKTQSPEVQQLLFSKDIFKHLIDETVRIRSAETEHGAGELLLFQQALIKLSSLSEKGEENPEITDRRLALRTLLDTLTDFELQDLLNGRHEMKRLLEEAGIPEKVISTAAQEQLSRHVTLWAIDRASEWSRLTLKSQILTPAESALADLEKALGNEGLHPERVKQAWAQGLSGHARIFERLENLYQLRMSEIQKGPVRDRVDHLETWRLSIGFIVGSIGLLMGILWRLSRKAASQPYSFSRKNAKGLFSRFFLGAVVAAMAFPADESQANEPASLPAAVQTPRSELREAQSALLEALEEKTDWQRFIFISRQLRGEDLAQRMNLSIPSRDQARGTLLLNYKSGEFDETLIAQWIQTMIQGGHSGRIIFYQDTSADEETWKSFMAKIRKVSAGGFITVQFAGKRQYPEFEKYLDELSRQTRLKRDWMIQVEGRVLSRGEKVSERTLGLLSGAAALSENTVVILGREERVSGVSAVGAAALTAAVFAAMAAIQRSA